MRNSRFSHFPIMWSIVVVFVCVSGVYAGELEPPGPPDDPISGGFTLEDLYQQLTTGNAGVKRTGMFPEPPGAPADQGFTIDEIQAVLPRKNDSTGASVHDVECNKTFWGLRGDAWGEQTGIRGAPLWYPDSDGDGYGDASAFPEPACDQIPGYVADHTDCNDADPAIHPGAVETCGDNVDSDCNSANDSLPVWYPDSDGDGYGDASASPEPACDQPAGYVADHTDCNDADPAIHPGAVETDNDGIDSDCNGSDGWDVVIMDIDGWYINLKRVRTRARATSYEGELRYTSGANTYTGPAVAMYLVDNDSFTITATDGVPYSPGEITYSFQWTTGPNMTGGYVYKNTPSRVDAITATLLSGNVGGHTP